MRAVIDTNVLASALIRRQGVAGQVLALLRDNRFSIVYSVPLLVELIDVLSRPSNQNKYHIQPDDITVLINLLRLRGELITPQRKIDVCRDASDNRVLEAAAEANAGAIVSGDSDLLDLVEFESIPIVSVAAFLARF